MLAEGDGRERRRPQRRLEGEGRPERLRRAQRERRGPAAVPGRGLAGERDGDAHMSCSLTPINTYTGQARAALIHAMLDRAFIWNLVMSACGRSEPRLAAAITQIVELGATYLAATLDFDLNERMFQQKSWRNCARDCLFCWWHEPCGFATMRRRDTNKELTLCTP